MTRRVVKIDVTDYMRQVAKGAGVAWDDADKFILPLSMWRKMKRILNLDIYIPEETDQDNQGKQDAS